MKYFVVSILFLVLTVAKGQDNSNDTFAYMSFVKNDTVLLRWAPKEVSTLRNGLEHGFIIERIETSSGSSFIGNLTLKTFELAPSTEKLSLGSNPEKTKQYGAMLDGFLKDKGMKTEDQQYLFGVLLLTAGADNVLADFMNLYFMDTTIDNKKSYIYKVSVQSNDEASFEIKVNASKKSQHWSFGSLVGAAKNRNKEIFLSWNAAQLQRDYSAYWIERSSDSIHYSRVNQLPYFFFRSSDDKDKKLIDFIDTTAISGETYFYRINGISHFGESGGYSNIVKIKLKKVLEGYVRLDTIYANKMDRLIEGRYIPLDKKDQKNLKEFVLFRSKEKHTGFEVVDKVEASGVDFNFTTNSLLESGDRYYYKIGAVSTDDDTIYSFTRYFFTLDQIPPSKPNGLEGVINEEGIVSLKWINNSEDDIRGYRVFRSNSLKEEFVEVSKDFITTNDFLDTLRLNNLTSDIYYKIAAVDLNYNNSKHSDIVKLNKPDTIAPVPCVFSNYSSDQKGLKLEWYNSSSKDVKLNQLYRKNASGSDIKVISWNDSLSVFADSLAILGSKNTYFIKTEDLSGNTSSSELFTVIYETGKRPSVKGLKGEVNREAKIIKLTWESLNENVYSIKIYRAKDEGNYKLIETIRDGKIVEYIDSDLYINNQYRYKMKVTYQSGVSSEYSNEVLLVY